MKGAFEGLSKEEIWEEILQRTKVPSPEFTEEERRIIDVLFAGKSGATNRSVKKRRSMRVRLTKGKEEYIFNDVEECARALGMAKNTVITYASGNRTRKTGDLAGWKFEYIRNG